MHIIAFSFEGGGSDNRLMRGGLSPLVWNLCREYAARGHRVSPVTPAHGQLDAPRERCGLEELDYRATDTVPLVPDPKVWPREPQRVALRLTTRAYRTRLEGVDVHFLSGAYLDLLPDRRDPPPGMEGPGPGGAARPAGGHAARRERGSVRGHRGGGAEPIPVTA
ncbi:hypothetical protein [Streptomyces sp. NPDC058739]|uniref:hypothetical protein n=1 Tax=Streptomyces sp. NPDC058739 TaxID=3346618 RepID=UPI003682C86B